MTLPGGPADKLGNRYEQWWTLSELIRMLNGETEALRIEDPAVDKAEFVVTIGSRRELHQAKRSHPSGKWQAAVVRLLLLTGCRKSEILTLRWSDYREGHLFLRDSKTGPRTVWLSQPARDVLDGLDRTGQWVFPAARGRGPRNKSWLEGFWDEVRAEAGLHGVRLHDLRHTCASFDYRLAA